MNDEQHRYVLAPGDDLTNEDARVSAIGTATWTPEVIISYEAMIAEQEINN